LLGLECDIFSDSQNSSLDSVSQASDYISLLNANATRYGLAGTNQCGAMPATLGLECSIWSLTSGFSLNKETTWQVYIGTTVGCATLWEAIAGAEIYVCTQPSVTSFCTISLASIFYDSAGQTLLPSLLF